MEYKTEVTNITVGIKNGFLW